MLVRHPGREERHGPTSYDDRVDESHTRPSGVDPMHGAESDSSLRVEFAGEHHSVSSGSRLSFGRDADLDIDDNPYLHRVLGEFFFDSGLWWLANTGSAIAISITDRRSPSHARLSPGSSMPIAFDLANIRFEAGGTSYELTVDTPGAVRSANGDEPADIGVDDDDDDDDESADVAEMTTSTASLPLTDDQQMLLRVLAAPLLTGADTLPTNRQLASDLGWTVTKWNRKLDGLCRKFSNAGISGLHGSSDQLAKDRRSRLAEHVIDAGIVRLQDIDGTRTGHGPDLRP